MATTITPYNQLADMLNNASADLDAVTIKVALVTSSYTFSAADDEWADASGNEVASGDGYTTGGETLGSVANTPSGATSTLDAADVTWTALTKTFRRAIAYISGTAYGKTNPLLWAILFDDTPADVSVAGVDFKIVWNASGILTTTVSGA